MRTYLLVVLLTLYIRLVGFTSRIKYIGRENVPKSPFIYIFWHSRLMLLAYAFKGKAVNILVSTSKDGDISAGVNSGLGYSIMRGTASTAGEGRRSLLKIIRALKEKKVIALTPDGPRGPALKVKKGLPFISQKTGCPLLPVSNAVKRKVVLNTWDKFILPLPFNKIFVVIGEPIYIKPEDDLDVSVKKIETILNELNVKTDKFIEKT